MSPNPRVINLHITSYIQYPEPPSTIGVDEFIPYGNAKLRESSSIHDSTQGLFSENSQLSRVEFVLLCCEGGFPWVLGGSSQLGYVVNNHGDRKSPKDRVILLPNGLNGL